jgi:segregation and condensation protein B
MVNPEPLSERGDQQLRSLLESLLLVAGGPVSIGSLAATVEEPRRRVRRVLVDLQRSLSGGVQVQIDGDQVQYVTAPENAEVVRQFMGTEKPAALSRSVLETLTIIAYRQPVTRSEVETARGANSDRQVQTLMARGLIEELGQRDTIGRPMEYGTSFAFLEYFGLRSLEDLPPIPEASVSSGLGTEIGLRAVTPSLFENEEGSQDQA